jgi:hypothetical protein
LYHGDAMQFATGRPALVRPSSLRQAEFEELKTTIATLVAEAGLTLINPLHDRFTDLKSENDESIRKYGVVI